MVNRRDLQLSGAGGRGGTGQPAVLRVRDISLSPDGTTAGSGEGTRDTLKQIHGKLARRDRGSAQDKAVINQQTHM
jgi:hypothetical protein